MLVQIKNMLVQIKIINIFCVPILTSIKMLIYCLSVTQPNIVTSLIEKEPINTQVSLFLDKLEFQWSF